MRSKIILMVSLLLLLGCSSSNSKRNGVIINNDTSTIVVVNDSIVLEFDSSLSTSQIIEETRLVFDSIIIDNSLSEAELQRLNQLDSVSFRRITKKINGGYNGWADRWKLYNNAKRALADYPDTLIQKKR